FFDDLTEFDPMIAALQPLVDKVWQHCANTGNRGRTVTLKVRFTDFEIMSRSQSMPTAVSNREELERVAASLLERSMPLPKAVRLLGVSLSTLQTKGDDAQSQFQLPI
ncbi:MAG: DNA polymerase IV, partial [Tardiphaga sp.]